MTHCLNPRAPRMAGLGQPAFHPDNRVVICPPSPSQNMGHLSALTLTGNICMSPYFLRNLATLAMGLLAVPITSSSGSSCSAAAQRGAPTEQGGSG